MTSNVSHIYYEHQQTNDTSKKVIIDKTINRATPILQKGDDYAMAILKFSFDASNLETFINETAGDYRIKIGGYKSSGIMGSPNLYQEKYAWYDLPLSANVVNPYTYNNYNDVIEGFNRSAISCYRNFLFNCGQKMTLQSNFNFDINQTSHFQTINLATNQDYGDHLGHLRLTLNMGWVGVENVGTANSNTGHPMVVYLESPGGVLCLVTRGSFKRGDVFVFSDAELKTQDQMIKSDTLQNYNQPGSYQPLESFVKFSNVTDSVFGNWKLKFYSLDSKVPTLHNFHSNVDYTIELFTTPKENRTIYTEYAIAPPALSHNSTTNKLELVLHEYFIKGGNYIAFSPKLHNILGFKGTIDNSGDFYKINLPQVILSTTGSEYITYAQAVSTTYKLNLIKSIQIRSSTISVQGEFSSTTTAPIIMSLDITSDTVIDTLEFVSNNNRWFDLIDGSPLNTINFSVWIVYRNGTERIATLSPFTDFNLLAAFIKKNKLIG